MKFTPKIIPMTKEEYLNKDTTLTIYFSTFKTQFGMCLVASTHKGVCNILFGDSNMEVLDELKSRWPGVKLISKKDSLHESIKEFFDTGILKTKIKLHIYGTPFQLKVWETLLTVPSGSTCTYGQIAALIGDTKKSRAVGTSIGKNPIGYIIPCHRVLPASGKVGGYRWGAVRKQHMLDFEAIQKSKA